MKFLNRPITKNTTRIFSLNKASLSTNKPKLLEEMKKVPYQKDRSEIADRVIESLHGIPYAYATRGRPDLGHIEAYIGITANPYARFSQHNMKLPYGIIVCKTDGKKASQLESSAIALLEYLKRKKGLCIHSLVNIKAGSSPLKSNSAYIYILFKLRRNCRGHGEILKDDIQKLSFQLEEFLELKKVKSNGPTDWIKKFLKKTIDKGSMLRLAHQE